MKIQAYAELIWHVCLRVHNEEARGVGIHDVPQSACEMTNANSLEGV